MTIPTTDESVSNTAAAATAATPTKSVWTRVAQITLSIAALLLVRNVFVTYNSMESNPGVGFFDLFFVTTNVDGENDIVLMLMTWAPFILLPIGLISAIIARVTGNKG